jgi:Calcium-binding EGF domain
MVWRKYKCYLTLISDLVNSPHKSNFCKSSCTLGYLGYTEPSCTPTECTNNGVICGYGALCIVKNETNTTTYSCECPLGYGGNVSDICVDVNECEQNTTICSNDGTRVCTNTIGSYRCSTKDWDACTSPTECSTTSSCEYKSRSEQNKKVCCSSYGSCNNVNDANICCNGAYTLNERCPSRNSKDCRTDLDCARESTSTLTYICCGDSYFPPFQAEPVCR